MLENGIFKLDNFILDAIYIITGGHILGSCLGYNWSPKPKGQINLGLKSPIQWICREWVGKLGFNELDNK